MAGMLQIGLCASILASLAAFVTAIDDARAIRGAIAGTYSFASAGPAILAIGLALVAIALARLRRVERQLARSEALARHLASHDSLSGLPNRRAFDAALDDALAETCAGRGGAGLIFFDLDRFKEVNDGFGHEVGDALIRAVAKRVGNALGPRQTLARLGGDEFAVVCAGVAGKPEVEILARRLLAEFVAPFDLGGRKVAATASIGVAAAPDDAGDRVGLTQLADIALYRAKNEGRNRCRVYDPRIGAERQKRVVVGRELEDAIALDGLALAYQPIFAADAGRIVGVEALLRWTHPSLGAVPPDLVVSVAEERGLMPRLGEWVLRRACLDAAAWPGLRVAVNVSPNQFRQREFVANVTRILEEARFDPNRLELELTEGVIVSEADLAEASMVALRDMGVRMALDDFGTGYASLIYLRRFPFDKIKIDRSFLESLEATGESRTLIDSIVNLGRALGLTVTAEGVETPEQLRLLQEIGCHELQGYLLSRPIAAAAIGALLALERAAQAPLSAAAMA